MVPSGNRQALEVPLGKLLVLMEFTLLICGGARLFGETGNETLKGMEHDSVEGTASESVGLSGPLFVVSAFLDEGKRGVRDVRLLLFCGFNWSAILENPMDLLHNEIDVAVYINLPWWERKSLKLTRDLLLNFLSAEGTFAECKPPLGACFLAVGIEGDLGGGNNVVILGIDLLDFGRPG